MSGEVRISCVTFDMRMDLRQQKENSANGGGRE